MFAAIVSFVILLPAREGSELLLFLFLDHPRV